MNTVNAQEKDVHRFLRCEAEIPATVAELWHCWTTNEGIRSFLVPDCAIDLRVGGKYEIYFDSNKESQERGSEGCVILAIEEHKMLSFTWNAPPTIPETRNQHTAVIVRFHELENGHSKVVLSHYGWGESAAWDATFTYFQRAWPNVLAALKKRFEK